MTDPRREALRQIAAGLRDVAAGVSALANEPAAPEPVKLVPEADGALRPAEAAELLGVSRSTLYALARTDGFPAAIRISGQRRWMRSALVAYLQCLMTVTEAAS
jgi:excisionase family DNA binding protein